MIRRNRHALPEIKAMCVEALHAGIELKALAIVGAGQLAQPIEQSLAVAARTRIPIGDEIIDIQKAPVRQHFHHAKTGDGLDAIAGFKKRHLKSVLLLPTNPRYEIGCFKMRSQLRHHGEATLNFEIGLGEMNRAIVAQCLAAHRARPLP